MFATTSPFAFLTIPKFGKPVTVIVIAFASGSVGAVKPNGVPVLSSATVIALLLATGGSFVKTVNVPASEIVGQA